MLLQVAAALVCFRTNALDVSLETSHHVHVFTESLLHVCEE